MPAERIENLLARPTRQVRQRFSAEELPILAVTCGVAREVRDAVLVAGANDYLAKPLDQIDLALRTRNLLALRNAYKAHAAIHSDLASEVNERTAKLDLLIQSGLMLSMEHDHSKLLRHILFRGPAVAELRWQYGLSRIGTEHARPENPAFFPANPGRYAARLRAASL